MIIRSAGLDYFIRILVASNDIEPQLFYIPPDPTPPAAAYEEAMRAAISANAPVDSPSHQQIIHQDWSTDSSQNSLQERNHGRHDDQITVDAAWLRSVCEILPSRYQSNLPKYVVERFRCNRPVEERDPLEMLVDRGINSHPGDPLSIHATVEQTGQDPQELQSGYPAEQRQQKLQEEKKTKERCHKNIRVSSSPCKKESALKNAQTCIDAILRMDEPVNPRTPMSPNISDQDVEEEGNDMVHEDQECDELYEGIKSTSLNASSDHASLSSIKSLDMSLNNSIHSLDPSHSGHSSPIKNLCIKKGINIKTHKNKPKEKKATGRAMFKPHQVKRVCSNIIKGKSKKDSSLSAHKNNTKSNPNSIKENKTKNAKNKMEVSSTSNKTKKALKTMGLIESLEEEKIKRTSLSLQDIQKVVTCLGITKIKDPSIIVDNTNNNPTISMIRQDMQTKNDLLSSPIIDPLCPNITMTNTHKQIILDLELNQGTDDEQLVDYGEGLEEADV